MRGRVTGIYALLFVGTTPIGAHVMGQLAQAVGVPTMVLILAALCGLRVVGGLAYIRGAGAVDLVTVSESSDGGLDDLDMEDGSEPA